MAVSGGGGAVRMRTCLSLITGIACPFLGSVLFGRHICSEYRGSENAEECGREVTEFSEPKITVGRRGMEKSLWLHRLQRVGIVGGALQIETRFEITL